jgi:CelD/BcsL family acetyltransferase involved in cellulose biosynthesis
MSLKSIFFYPPLTPAVYLRSPAEQLPFPLDDPRCFLFSRGRHAIAQAAAALCLKSGDRVLAPAWHHGAEIEALRRAGLEVDFYELGPTLEPAEEDLDALVGPRTRMLFLTHYLGFPRDAGRWRAWCDERRLLLFEDAAHASLARAARGPIGSLGDAAVWCLFKSFPVPDGAALRLRRDAPEAPLDTERGIAPTLRAHMQWLLQRAPSLAAAVPERSGSKGFDLAAEIDLGDPHSGPLTATTWLLPRVASEDAAHRRRANYGMLLDELGTKVPPPFDQLPDGAVPLGMPLRVPAKHDLIERVEARGIDAVDFWSAPHPLLPATEPAFAATAERRASTVLLPVHQGLRPSDLERIADAAQLPRKAPRPELRVERAQSIDELYDDWSALATRSRNLFATPEWTATWCRHMLHDRSLELFAFRSGSGRLVGVLPLYVHSERPLRILRLAGHGPGEELGPVCCPEDRPQVARALLRTLAGLGGGILVAEQLPAEAGWGALTGGHALRSEPSPAVTPHAAGWDGYLAGCSRRMRKELRRQQRRIETLNGVHYRSGGGSAEELQRDLDTLFSLHDAVFGDDSRFLGHADFHREFAEIARQRRWLRMWFLEIDGCAVAAWYGFRYAGVELDYQGGRDPAWEGFSVGTAIIAHAMRSALEEGVDEYRLLRGAERYKQRFATHDRGLETLVIGNGAIAGLAAAAAAALPDRVASAAKRRLAA